MKESCRSNWRFCFVWAFIVVVIDIVFRSFNQRDPELGLRAPGMAAKLPASIWFSRFAGELPLEPGEDTKVPLELARVARLDSSAGLPSTIEKDTTVESLDRLATGFEKTRPEEAKLARFPVVADTGPMEEDDALCSIIVESRGTT